MEAALNARILAPGDEAALTPFLEARSDSSLILRSNLATGGLTDRGAPSQGTWAGAFDGASLIGVVAHFWNGVLIHQAAEELVVPLGQMAARATGRPIKGLLGPWAQVAAARRGHGLEEAATGLRSKEELMALDLEALQVPSQLTSGEWVCRTGHPEDFEALVHLRAEFRLKAIREKEHPGLRAECEAEVRRGLEARSFFLLLDRGAPVSTCVYSGRMPDCVQIGGVWTPEALRGRGYARAVVAGALLHAQSEGVRRSVLFTGEQNHAALKSYRAIGYARIADYGIIYFREPRLL